MKIFSDNNNLPIVVDKNQSNEVVIVLFVIFLGLRIEIKF